MSKNLILSFACAAGTLVACAGDAVSVPELHLPVELVHDCESVHGVVCSIY